VKANLKKRKGELYPETNNLLRSAMNRIFTEKRGGANVKQGIREKSLHSSQRKCRSQIKKKR